jgi:predicted metal-dependent hydrolase
MNGKARQEVGRGQVLLGSRSVSYRVVVSRKARHIRLRMLSDGMVEVVVPARVTIPPIEGLLRSKQGWICRGLDRVEAVPEVPNNCVEYLGSEYPVIVRRHDVQTGRITLRAGEFRVELPYGAAPAPLVEALLRNLARALLTEQVQVWAEAMQVEFTRLSVRDQRTRWGSCSAKGSLSFSWRLVMAPLPVLEYVVIHELMHLRKMNHGKQFWEGVERYCPEYRQHRTWLKEHGAQLARPLNIVGDEAA